VWQFALLGAIFTTTATLYNTGLALVAGSAGNWLRERPGFLRAQRWVSGACGSRLGVRIVVVERG
jgi:threonine/homoserine/homoserine lactone efflux protein